MKSILLPELPTHAVDSERLFVLQQSLLEMGLACNDQSSVRIRSILHQEEDLSQR